MTKASFPLSKWSWRMANSNGNAQAESLPVLREWSPVGAFPSVVQMELQKKGLISDVNLAENERVIQWAGHVDWEYRTFFDTPPETFERDHVDLVMQGLDTFATVKLNGEEILKSTNMFVPARLPVKDKLKPSGETNELLILFESAFKIGDQLNKKYGERWSRMRDPKRHHTRKAQYHWGWDWGPVMLTAGPYMPIDLEAYDVRVGSVYVVPTLAADHSSAKVSLEVKTLKTTRPVHVDISVVDAAGKEVYAHSGLNDTDLFITQFTITNPELWWCNGLGSQHLYTAHVSIVDSDSTPPLDSRSVRFGVKKIELIERPLDKEPGTTFMFRINGRDIFAQGANWIPADMMLPTISRQRYFDWIRTVVLGNMNMIRVWGGGIYETEDFMDACDEMGVLVWHDYAFACGDYLIHDEFIESIAREAEAQTLRLRNRASLALLCGGNEDFLFYDWLKGGGYDHEDLTGPFDDQPFPQRKIYLETLPRVVNKLCPNVIYYPNSPWGGKTWVNDLTVGDVHQWSVWHHDQEPYQNYKSLAGRFVSEFGMHGFPVNRTVQHLLRGTPKSAHHPQSRVVDCHNKARGGHTRVARYLAENFRFDNSSLENYTYTTHLLQSEAYAYALRDWKRLFNGPGEERCAGALIWQLNDVYPGISWAFVDYFIRPKPAFYAIRREFAPISVGLERSPRSRWVDENAVRESDVPSFEIFGHNTTASEVKCTLVLRAYDFALGLWTNLAPEDATREVTLRAGYNTELGALGSHASWGNESLIVLEATLFDSLSGKRLARSVDWPEPFRYLQWPDDTRLWIRVTELTNVDEGERWENEVTMKANQPLKGVWLEPKYDGFEKDEDPEPFWDDNMVDLMPGEELSVRVYGLKGRKVRARFLADWEVGHMTGS
ncbi:glycoside hydrolase superfamily [Xylariaceae sp. FL0662B]|nr:glycoside hydrolase superfamily [Xylariaceae sp. FL0662B]